MKGSADLNVGLPTFQGQLGKFTLHLHGSKEMPTYLSQGPRKYNEDYNRVHKKTANVATTAPGNLEDFSNYDWKDIIGIPVALRGQDNRKQRN
uniref:Uncharacterized protein n=1 Tax=Timema tahoe TaxID=61484 RepID=A0A7R9IAZ2_9NEOP|nr:unnamed protein product [Timema tahoe]